MRILYKYPTRERPEKFFQSLDNFYSLVSHDNYQILVTLDIDDPTVTNIDFKQRILKYDNLKCFWGTSHGKVSAINRDMCFADNFDILVLLSDDMHLQPGFDIEILKAFEDGFKGLAHFPDGIVNERLCTFSVMHSSFYEYFGWIYNPAYESIGCDNEQHEVAIILGEYKYIPIVIVRHLHPAYGMAPNDDLYRRNEDPVLYTKDLQTLAHRRSENFGINS